MLPIDCVAKKRKCHIAPLSKQLVTCCRTVGKIMLPVVFVWWGMAGLLVFSSARADAQEKPVRTWKTVAELSAEERASLDLSPETPRHPQFPYLPAEPYPFSPPYTAEEMGLRAMEFTHWPRWSCAFVQVYASLDAHGFFVSWGKNISLISHREPMGLAGYLYTEPGQNHYRALLQYTAPPEQSGNQTLYIRYRTDQAVTKKQDAFRYASSLRRVRRYPAMPRQSKYPGYAMTFDDDVGRDAWEFSWRVIGTDVLSETVRFPRTRPSLTLANSDGTFTEVPTKALKMMGEEYPLYTTDGGVRCYVVEARAKPEWLPDYYAPRLLYWLDQHTFFPLRMEEYGKDGNLVYIGVRVASQMNRELGDRGYGVLIQLEWDVPTDLLSYVLQDAHRVHRWAAADQQIFFTPEFMTRSWVLMNLKSQADVFTPEEFFLRPALAEDKFPQERNMVMSAELRARIQAQEEAGRPVFTTGENAVPRAAIHSVSGVEEDSVSGLQLLPTPLSGLDGVKKLNSRGFVIR